MDRSGLPCPRQRTTGLGDGHWVWFGVSNALRSGEAKWIECQLGGVALTAELSGFGRWIRGWVGGYFGLWVSEVYAAGLDGRFLQGVS